MITDGLNPFTVLLFAGAVLTAGALVVAYAVARITKRDSLARIALRVLLGGAGVYVVLLLIGGNQYPGSVDGLQRQLTPGESYTTDITFEVPLKATGLRLILRNADPETRVIVGHENSLLHGKTLFRLPG